ncbi:uncharacterized protein V2V93DRAFT_373879, partial [Kockiozyma suomiensis]|uniref:uncharacterized protein n=1 Tax=Kockiozyma suomiensis TaxID=1337062 RepID=UPI003343788E
MVLGFSRGQLNTASVEDAQEGSDRSIGMNDGTAQYFHRAISYNKQKNSSTSDNSAVLSQQRVARDIPSSQRAQLAREDTSSARDFSGQPMLLKSNRRDGFAQSLRALKLRNVDMIKPNPRLRFQYEPTQRMMVPIDPYKDAKWLQTSQLQDEQGESFSDNLDAHEIKIAMDRDKKGLPIYYQPALNSANQRTAPNEGNDPGDRREGWPWRDSRELKNVESARTHDAQPTERFQTTDEIGSKPRSIPETSLDADDSIRESIYQYNHFSAKKSDRELKSRSRRRVPRYQEADMSADSSRQDSEESSITDIPRRDVNSDFESDAGIILTTAWTNHLKRATASRIKAEQEKRLMELNVWPADYNQKPATEDRPESSYSEENSSGSESSYKNPTVVESDVSWHSDQSMERRNCSLGTKSSTLTPEISGSSDNDLDKTPLARERIQKAAAFKLLRVSKLAEEPMPDDDIPFLGRKRQSVLHSKNTSLATVSTEELYSDSADENYLYDSGMLARRARIVRQSQPDHGFTAERV